LTCATFGAKLYLMSKTGSIITPPSVDVLIDCARRDRIIDAHIGPMGLRQTRGEEYARGRTIRFTVDGELFIARVVKK
jgi:hypothetical protein